ncbi:MAG TPA: MFS transporter [Actinomycetota bacterium]|nr:MFS transporter [Actinomycetota bacterium]
MRTPAAGVADRPPRWREVFRGRRGRLTAGLLLLEALVAMHALVVVTILPDVRRDLGMVQLYGLTFTAASLATLGAIPIAGRAVDRLGTRRIVPPVLGVFTAGLIVAATAPAMPLVLVGQFLAGAGGGGLYAMSLGTVAKTFPDRLRPRVLALLASMWVLPGLIGPPLGAALASTVGWRWAFLAPLPLLAIGWALIAPALDLVETDGDGDTGLDVRWPLQLMVGAGIVFTAITVVEPWAVVAVAAGSLIALPALTRIVPPGTFRAAAGVPASAATAFMLSVSFLAIDAFLTLMLTDVRGLSIGQAGLAVTGATVTMAHGSTIVIDVNTMPAPTMSCSGQRTSRLVSPSDPVSTRSSAGAISAHPIASSGSGARNAPRHPTVLASAAPSGGPISPGTTHIDARSASTRGRRRSG